MKRKSKAKDEFDHATDWKRVFKQLYLRLKWLNAYSRINYIAIQK